MPVPARTRATATKATKATKKAGTAGTARARGQGRAASLTREGIVERALELAERDGPTALSLRRLGEEIGVDATAFYRHFRDKDELVLAMFDEVIGAQAEHVRALAPGLPWRAKLRALAASSWETSRRYPATFGLAFARTTGGPAERQIVEFILATLVGTGLPAETVVLHYRAYADALLSLCAMNAIVTSLEPALRQKDASAWSRIYAVLPEEEYPAARSHARQLGDVSEEAVYYAVIDGVLGGIEAAIAAVAT